MLKKLLSLAVICTAMSAHANLITDFIKGMEGYDVLTLTKGPAMFKDENVGMEVFRASGLKNNLYQDGCGVDLVTEGGAWGYLGTHTIQGFYNGNFDVKLNTSLIGYTLNGEDNPGRDLKPDGTAGEYAGMYLSITPCIVIKDFIYVPLDLSKIEGLGALDDLNNVIGYATTNDASGLDNMHFDAISMPNLGESLSSIIPAESLAALVKAGVNAGLQNETVAKLVGDIIDRVVSSNGGNYLSLLDDAKINAMQIQIYDKVEAEDGTVTKNVIKTENFNGYELHSIKSMGYITDRIITDLTVDSYGIIKDTDPVRRYKFAYTIEGTDENGYRRVNFYNFDNAGLAIHTEVVQDVTENEDGTTTTGSRHFVNSLHPVTGYIDDKGYLNFDRRQMLGCTPILDTEAGNGFLNTAIVKLLAPCTRSLGSIFDKDKNEIKPAWDLLGTATVKTESSFSTPVHIGSDTWSSVHGGTLKTVPSLMDIKVGAYCAQNFNLFASTNTTLDLRTTNHITYNGEMKITAVTDECTHEVELVLTKVGFKSDDNRGLYVAGTIIPGDNAQYVKSYDLMLVPKDVADMEAVNGDESIWLHADNGFEHGHNAIIGAKKVTAIVAGPQYDVNSPAAATQSLSGNLSFEKLVPYTDIQKVTKKGLSYNIVNATDADDYTFFVRTNYLDETNLAPSFHALTPKSEYVDAVITGVSDITVDGDDSDAPAVFYNLQGVQLPQRPTTPGLYIERHGKTSEKVYIR